MDACAMRLVVADVMPEELRSSTVRIQTRFHTENALLIVCPPKAGAQA